MYIDSQTRQPAKARSLFVRFPAFLFCAAIMIAGGFFGSHPAGAQANPPVNLGRACFNVIDFGADPTGANPAKTLQAFQHAFAAASLINGSAVCAPAGTYELDGDVTLFSNSTTSFATNAMQGGPSFFGAGPGLTIIRENYSGNVFDSCPSFGNVSPPGFSTPAPCPSVFATPTPTTPPATPSPNLYTRINGVVFANFSIVHLSSSVGTYADFNFPEITSLLVDNVCDENATNVFDLGDQYKSSTWGQVTIKDSSCGFQFSTHFVAVHGSGGGLIVQNNVLEAGGTGIGFDSSDMTELTSGSAGLMSWVDNVVQQPFVGMFLFLGDDPVNPFAQPPGIQDSQWRGNEYDGCVLVCYYFGLDSEITANLPAFGHITMSDKDATSQYDSVFFNGASYTSAGVEGIQIGGPSSYTGSSGGTASSLLVLRGSPAPGSGDGVYVFWSGSTLPASYYTAPPSGSGSATMASIASNLSTIINSGAPPSPTAQVGHLANPSYALVGLTLRSRPVPGTYFAFPILIGTTGTIKVDGLPSAICPMLPGGGTATHCYSTAFDIGDGVALRNLARDIDVVHATVTSSGGAAIHVWADGGDVFHFLANVLGGDQQTTSFTGIKLDAPISSPPTDYHLAGNDVAGATNGIIDGLTAPAFSSTGSLPVMRAHRGAAGIDVGPISSSLTFTVTNSGPADCTFYFDWSLVSGHLVSLGLLYPALASATPAPLGISPPPGQGVLPVGAELVVTLGTALPLPTVTYAGACQP